MPILRFSTLSERNSIILAQNGLGNVLKFDHINSDKQSGYIDFADGEEAVKLKIEEINAVFRAAIKNIGHYTQEEIDTFHIQRKEYETYISDKNSSVPFVTEMARVRGLTLADLMGRIGKKVDIYILSVASALGKKQLELDKLR